MEVFIQRDGLKLHGLLEGTDQVQNSSVAILMHGFKGDLGYDNSKILYALSHYLNDQGIPTLRFDFDGSGKSDGRFEDMTVFSEWQIAINKLNTSSKHFSHKDFNG